MATTTKYKILSTTASDKDYASLVAVRDALTGSGNTLVDRDELWVLYVDGEYVLDAVQDLSSIVNDATRHIQIQPRPGTGFAENAGKLTNAFKYNAAVGSAIRCPSGVANYTTAMNFAGGGVKKISGMQLRVDSRGGVPCKLLEGAPAIFGCLLDVNTTSTNDGPSVELTAFINSLLVRNGDAGYTRTMIGVRYSVNVPVINSTFVCLDAAPCYVIGGSSDGGAPILKNCAMFGITAVVQADRAASWGNVCTYSVTSLSTLPGTGNLVSKTTAECFISATTDFRAKQGGPLIGAGTRDQANTNDLDAIGVARSVSTPTIGAWETASTAGGGAAPTINTQPASVTVTASNTANFTVASSGATTWQWQRSVNGGSTWNNVTDGTGATTSSYTTAAASTSGGTANNGDMFRCDLSNANGHTFTNGATLTVNAAQDTDPPSMLGSVSWSNITQTSARATWPAATDNIGVTGYEYSLDNGVSWTPNGTTLFKDLTSLTAGSTFPFRVRAYDQAGNRSTALTSSVTTLAASGITFSSSDIITNVQASPWRNQTNVTFQVETLNGTPVLTKTDGTTDANGKPGNFTHSSLTAGTTYRVKIILSNGAEGFVQKVAA